MRDLDVRVAVRSWLYEAHAGDIDTRIVEEMGVWSGSVRVDIAVINGELHGFELKSASDTLERLPAQAALYSEVFDRVTLVIAEKHARQASRIIPRWWGITLAKAAGSGGVAIRERRQASLNPRINPLQLARLLWRPEALRLLETHGLAKGIRSKPAEALFARLAAEVPTHILQQEVRSILKAREQWLGQLVPNQRDVTI